MAKETFLAQAKDLETLLESLEENVGRARVAIAERVTALKNEADNQGIMLVERLERHLEFARTVLRKEEVSVLKLGLASGEFSLAEREVMVDPQMWSSRLAELELKAAMSFLPSATKLCLGHLLLGTASNQPSNEEEAVASKVTGAGDQPGTSVLHVSSRESVATLPTLTISNPTFLTKDSAHSVISGPTEVKKWLEGSSCLARCPEDGVWCRARVVCQDSVKGDVNVMFVDKSSRAVVGANDIVFSVDELSEGERSLVDKVVWVANTVKNLKQVEVNKLRVTVPEADSVEEMVNGQSNPNPYCMTKVEAALLDDSLLVETSQGHTSPAEEIIVDTAGLVEENSFCLSVSAGRDCVAKWNEDDVWYRAQVAEVREDGKVLVVFSDYGNSAFVGEGELVAGVEGVPAGEEKDVHLVEAPTDEANLQSGENNIEAADDFVEEKYVKSEFAEEVRAVDDVEAVKKVEVVKEVEHNDDADVQALPRSHLVDLNVDDFCVACFSEDNIWYNAQVLEVVGAGRYRLLYTDYGNEEVVEAGRIVTSLVSLGGELVDPGVHQQWSTRTSKEDVDDTKVGMETSIDGQRDGEPTLENIEARDSKMSGGICEGENCLAIWGEDGVLYRAKLQAWLPDGLKAEVLFIDYDNKDVIEKEKLFREYSCVPEEFLQPDLVDFHVVKPPVENQSPLAGFSPAVHHAWSAKIEAPSGLLHLAILDDGRVVAAVCSQDRVLAFSSGGKPLADLQPLRRIEGLRAVAKVGKDRVAVLDSKGFQLFAGPGLKCERNLELKGLGTTGGTCLGDEGELVIVNRGAGGNGENMTSEEEVDLLFVSLETGKLRKRLEMVDILGEKSDESACNHIAYQDNRLHVMDSGLTQLYTLYEEDDEPQAMLCGSYEQWECPSGIAVDKDGSLLVADSATSRLLTVSPTWCFTGQLAADPKCPFDFPEALALNLLSRELVVHNEGTKEIVKYILSK